MSFSRDGIENVRAVLLPDAITATGRPVTVSRTASVTWCCSEPEMLYHIYVNESLAGVTIDNEQRQLVVPVPASLESAVRIEVIAVSPAKAHCDFGAELDAMPAASARVRLTLLRSQEIPAGASVNVYYDRSTGDVDYGEPLNAAPVPVWPCPQDKAGLGMAPFGTGDFGYEAGAAVGLGKGSFGCGAFGLDADVMEWISPVLPPGEYRFGVKVVDASGNESAGSETEPIAVVPAAVPASGLDVVTFDECTGLLTLGISEHQ